MLPPHVWQASSNDQHHFCVHTSSVVVVHIASSDLQKCCWPSGEFAAAFSRVAEGIPFEGTGCCPWSIDQVAGATWSSPRLASWVQVWRHSGEDLWTKRAFVEASSLVSIKIFRSSRLLCWLTLGQWGDCKGRESVGGNSNADTALTLCLRNVFFTSSHNAIHFFTAMTMYVEIVSSPTWVTLYCSTLVWPLLPGILFDVNLMVFAYWLCAPWSFESVIILILFNKAPWGLRTLMFSRFTSSSLPQSAQFFQLIYYIIVSEMTNALRHDGMNCNHPATVRAGIHCLTVWHVSSTTVGYYSSAVPTLTVTCSLLPESDQWLATLWI